MKRVLFLVLLSASTFAWSQESFQVLNTVHFGTYEHPDGLTDEKITFRLTIVNDGKTKIPDLGVTNRSEHVNFYINGEQSNPVSLYNGLEATDTEKVILPGDSGTYNYSWIMTDDAGVIEAYGKEFNVHWEYQGVKSDVLEVNIDHKTARTVVNAEKEKPKIDPDRKGQFDYLVTHADRSFKNKSYEGALKLYREAWRIYRFDDYVNAQIKICEQKLKE